MRHFVWKWENKGLKQSATHFCIFCYCVIPQNKIKVCSLMYNSLLWSLSDQIQQLCLWLEIPSVEVSDPHHNLPSLNVLWVVGRLLKQFFPIINKVVVPWVFKTMEIHSFCEIESFHRSNHFHFAVFWSNQCYKFWKKKFRKKLVDARNDFIDMHLIQSLKNEFWFDLPLFSKYPATSKNSYFYKMTLCIFMFYRNLLYCQFFILI